MSFHLPSSALSPPSLVSLFAELQQTISKPSTFKAGITRRTLQEVGSPPPHARMDVCFAGFDVVVEVISECLDMRNDFCLSLWGEMSWEEDYRREALSAKVAYKSKQTKPQPSKSEDGWWLVAYRK